MVVRQIPLRIAALALTVVVLCALCTPRTSAADVPKAPDVARGEHIARLVCSACHVVAVDQEFPPLLNQATPAFAEIANRPGVTAESLQRFITTTHWDVDKLPMSMPNPMLDKSEVQAVTRYILSLRKR
ncbi:MAG TPA: c-type cytochrome [Steroidobacteraceae bacterium]|nr:c-type cytochrome [Steroidobacteraceae bacterium]